MCDGPSLHPLLVVIFRDFKRRYDFPCHVGSHLKDRPAATMLESLACGLLPIRGECQNELLPIDWTVSVVS